MRNKSNNFISVKPKKWWMWITQWKQIRTMNKLINYMWENQGMDEKFRKAYFEMLMFGTGTIEIDIKEYGE